MNSSRVIWGSTGLLIAQGLKKAGISFSIFEREGSDGYRIRPRDWGMALHWATQYVGSCLPPDLADRTSEMMTDPFTTVNPDDNVLPFHNGKTGELLANLPIKNTVRISRRKMRKLCSEGIDIQYNKRLIDIKDDGGSKVTISFDDGTTASGSIIVGCEGARSAVREILLGPEEASLMRLPVTMFNFTEQYPAELALQLRKLHPAAFFGIHPDNHGIFLIAVQDVPEPEKPETWLFQLAISSMKISPREAELAESNEGRHEFIKERAQTYAEPWRSAALGVKDTTYIPNDTCSYWESPVPWDNHAGRITLSGDAAHAMTPHRGQGLNNAVQDAAHFVEAIKAVVADQQDLGKAISAYDEEMLGRGIREIKISARQSFMVHNYDQFLQSPLMKIGMVQQNTDYQLEPVS
ncbi:MAG: hypothetical protein M1827_004250 [Pycnora praestabilis]|nr:MAG: hypothetical protein M1827_004250 [Pycnora praestabilis]